MYMVAWVKILEAVCILHSIYNLGKDMNPTILALTMGKH